MMDTLLILVEVLLLICVVRCEVKIASACFGVNNCDHFELTCENGSRIHHLSQQYGYKDYKCEKKKNKCMKPSGCCTFEDRDCLESYNQLHLYNLMRECSRRTHCGLIPAPNNILATCGDNQSSYVYLQYECFNDETFLNMCERQELEGTEMNVIFDQSLNTLTQPTSCICDTTVIDGDEVDVNFVDVRMMRAHSETGSGSLCSSAILRGEPDSSGTQIQCNASISEEYNFKDNIVVRVRIDEGGRLRTILENLFVDGENDSPVMVWVNLRATVSGTLKTRCYPEAPTIPTHPVTTGGINTGATAVPVTGGSNNTGDSTKPVVGGEDNSTAVIVGVLIPVIIVIIAAVVVFIVWKRKRRPLKRRPATPNSYTSSVGSRNSSAANNAEYDEIGDLSSAPRPPLYDPVYETAKESTHGYVNAGQNCAAPSASQSEATAKKHNTYQNIKSNKESANGPNSKPNKNNFKHKKAQILSFFRRKNNDSLATPNIVKKPSDASVTSYDHLNASNPEVRLQVTPPPEELRNPYAHTSTYDPYTNTTDSVNDTEQTKDSEKQSPSPKGVKAVTVGDSYIEFQFGTLDDDDPNLLKPRAMNQENESHFKLMKPTRPPPKPSSPKLDKTKPIITVSKLSTATERESEGVNDQQTYDYADADEDVGPVGSSKQIVLSTTDQLSNADSRNSAMVYSYADVDDDENGTMDSLSPDLVYEVVDHSAETGLRKCSSAQDISCDTSGGYEVPLKTNSGRPISAPHGVATKANSKPKSAVKGIEDVVNKVISPIGLGNVVTELKEIQDLPDLSDPQTLPKELKYANLGLHTPKCKQRTEKIDNKVSKTAFEPQTNIKVPSQSQSTESNSTIEMDEKLEGPPIKKGVLSLAKKFEAPTKT